MLALQFPLDGGNGVVAVLRVDEHGVGDHVGQDMAVGVHHRHLVRSKAVNAVGHQMDDGLHLRGAKGRAGAQAQQHRGCGRPLLFQEQTLLRDDHADPRGVHRGKLGDGARQLALNGAGVGDPLLELAHPHLRVVEDLKPRAPALGEPLLGKGQARLIDVPAPHEDSVRRGVQLVGDVVLPQIINDCGLVLHLQPCEERLVGGASRHEDKRSEPSQDQEGDQDERGPLPQLQGRPKTKKGPKPAL